MTNGTIQERKAYVFDLFIFLFTNNAINLYSNHPTKAQTCSLLSNCSGHFCFLLGNSRLNQNLLFFYLIELVAFFILFEIIKWPFRFNVKPLFRIQIRCFWIIGSLKYSILAVLHNHYYLFHHEAF